MKNEIITDPAVGLSIFKKIPPASQRTISYYFQEYRKALYSGKPSDVWFFKLKGYIEWLLNKGFLYSNEIFLLMRHLDVNTERSSVCKSTK